MFIEKRYENDNILAFIKSKNIQVFPCGRRRSTDIAGTGTRLPFDPEARLNTEANNRKHSSLNGFTQTYLKEWDTTGKRLSLSIAGYLFDILLTNDDTDYSEAEDFATELLGKLVEISDLDDAIWDF